MAVPVDVPAANGLAAGGLAPSSRPADSFQVFVSHGRVNDAIQPQVIEVIRALDAVPHVLPRVDVYRDDDQIDRRIAFISDGSDWRDRIDATLRRVHAAVVCLDEASANSPWVLHEAEVLAERRRTQPGFAVFYLSDGEIVRDPAGKPWKRWDPIRPSDHQLTRWNRLHELVEQIGLLPPPTSAAPTLQQFAGRLRSALRQDEDLKGHVVETLASKLNPLNSVWQDVIERVPAENLDAAWVANSFANYVVAARRRGISLKGLDPMLDVVMGALNPPGGATDVRLDTLQCLLPLLPSDSECSLARRHVDVGPQPDARFRGVRRGEVAPPAPVLLTVGSDGAAPVGGRIDVRRAAMGEVPAYQPSVTGSDLRRSFSRHEYEPYLRDLLAGALGIVASGNELVEQVPIFDAGDIGIDGTPPSLGTLLHDAIVAGPSPENGSGFDAADAHGYCPDEKRPNDVPVRPGHVVVRCGSYRRARRLLAATGSGEVHRENVAVDQPPAGSLPACIPRCTVLLDVTDADDDERLAVVALIGPATDGGAGGGTAIELERLVLSSDRLQTRHRDQQLIEHKRNERK